MHTVYILRCAGNHLYVGETNDLAGRLRRHDAGIACRFTTMYRPVGLVYSEEHANRAHARARERQIKRWTRAKKEALIAGDLISVGRL